jgi:leucyl-tRNA synthetase
MAGSVDSSWYFLRYTSPQDSEHAWTRSAADYWMPVDLYLGGREHAVGHLLYARFFTKVFFDAGLISVDEPAMELRNQGMLLGLTAVERVPSAEDPRKTEFKAIKPEELIGFDIDSWTTRFQNEGPFPAERILKPKDEPERIEPVTVEFAWLKMSKSKGNSVTPDEMAEKYGADALRLYVLFEAPYEDTIQWSEERMSGTFRFLSRVWDIVTQVAATFTPSYTDRLGEATSEEERTLRRKTHQTIQRTQDAIADLRFNTAVSGLMIHADALRKFVNANGTTSPAAQEAAVSLIKLLAPLAPHIADELYERLGFTNTYLWNVEWPVADASVAAEEAITLVVQVNGKLRDRLTLPADADEETCKNAALASERVQEFTEGKPPKKVIVIPGKLVNIVV